MKRIAIIDLGSNSIRFIIIEVESNGAYKLIYQEKKSIRLAEGMSPSSRLLSEEAQMRALRCLAVYAGIIKVQQVNKVLAVATAAVRNALNGASFLRRVHLSTGIPMTIISGQKEASLGVSGVLHTIDASDFLLFDLGGASVEISLIRNKKRLHSVSIPVGAVTLTEKFHSEDTVTKEQAEEIGKYISRLLDKIAWFPEEPIPVIGVGGTIRNLAKIDQRASVYPLHKLHNYQLPSKNLFAIVDMLCGKTRDERLKISGLSTERADIIIAGSLAVREIVKRARAPYLIISGCGLREGLFFHYYDSLYRQEPKGEKNMLLDSVRNYQRTLAPHDTLHTQYVTLMALSLFDQWAKRHQLPQRLRHVLAAAGYLHDVGTLINYYSHARHSAYMVANAHIFGWTHREQLMAALVCAFHHGYSGKMMKSFPHTCLLTEEDVRQVKILSLFLALAEALDENREHCITRLICADRKKAMDLRIYTSSDNFDVPAHAVNHLLKDFEKSFGIPLLIQWFPGTKGKNEILEKAKRLCAADAAVPESVHS